MTDDAFSKEISFPSSKSHIWLFVTRAHTFFVCRSLVAEKCVYIRRRLEHCVRFNGYSMRTPPFHIQQISIFILFSLLLSTSLRSACETRAFEKREYFFFCLLFVRFDSLSFVCPFQFLFGSKYLIFRRLHADRSEILAFLDAIHSEGYRTHMNSTASFVSRWFDRDIGKRENEKETEQRDNGNNSKWHKAERISAKCLIRFFVSC